MKKEKKLFSYLGSVFAFCFLALIMFLPDAKAEAALSVKEINYENSTITINSTSGDSVLYFSDKNKKKWETALVGFDANGDLTMDISWIALTKDYKITFKGDKTTEDILEVTIPKQDKTFKAKYNLKTKEVTFTNAGTRTIQYRKNNTDVWADARTAEEANATVSPMLERLAENGGSVYFRLKSEPGTSAADAGKRPSKEVACKVTKKTAAPTVSMDTSALTINVKSGWQVRKIENGEIKEKSSGFSYITGTSAKIQGLSPDYGSEADFDDKNWFTFHSEKDVPLSVLAPEALQNSGEPKDVYLQFRKAATASAQVSYTTTIKIPKQEETPKGDGVVRCEYTSLTSCNFTILAASSTVPYEYCTVDVDEMNPVGTIINPEDVTWNTVKAPTAIQIKKTTADDGSYVFYRKKAVGKVGDDSFALPTPAIAGIEGLDYPKQLDINVQCETIEGACTKDNSSAKITFAYYAKFRDKIKSIKLGTVAGAQGDITTEIESSAVQNKDSRGEDANDKYIITTVIKQINLTSDLQTLLKESGSQTLYAYIEFENNEEPLASTADKGLRIIMSPKSVIKSKEDAGSEAYNYVEEKGKIERFIGYQGEESFDTFLFNFAMPEKVSIESVYLGNYKLGQNTDWTYVGETFTVKLSEFEKKVPSSYYGVEKTLTINLSNHEKLSGITVKLIEPVSLKKEYTWAFTCGRLQETEKTYNDNGYLIKETPVYSYKVEYVPYEKEVNNVTVTKVQFEGADLTIGSTTGAIWAGSGEDGSGKEIKFSNEILNQLPRGSGNVKFRFKVQYGDEQEMKDYIIEKGCFFTIL